MRKIAQEIYQCGTLLVCADENTVPEKRWIYLFEVKPEMMPDLHKIPELGDVLTSNFKYDGIKYNELTGVIEIRCSDRLEVLRPKFNALDQFIQEINKNKLLTRELRIEDRNLSAKELWSRELPEEAESFLDSIGENVKVNSASSYDTTVDDFKLVCKEGEELADMGTFGNLVEKPSVSSRATAEANYRKALAKEILEGLESSEIIKRAVEIRDNWEIEEEGTPYVVKDVNKLASMSIENFDIESISVEDFNDGYTYKLVNYIHYTVCFQMNDIISRILSCDELDTLCDKVFKNNELIKRYGAVGSGHFSVQHNSMANRNDFNKFIELLNLFDLTVKEYIENLIYKAFNR